MAHDVFISYSSDDLTVADAICRAFESAGIRCWKAPSEVPSGSSSSAENSHAIQQGRVFVLILSEPSNNSADVRREVEIAANSRRPIVQFRIDAVPLAADLERWLGGSQRIEAIAAPLENHFGELTSSVKALLANPPAAHAVAAAPGAEPTSALPPTNLWRFVGGPLAALAHFGSDRERIIALVLLGSVAVVFSLTLLRPHGAQTAPPSVSSQSSAASAANPEPAPRMSIAPPSSSSVVGTEEAELYVKEFSRAMEQGDLPATVGCLGDTVDYSGFGPKEKSFLAEQLRQYFAAFPVRVFSVNDVKVQPGPQSDIATVIFNVQFSTRDTSGHTNAGRAHVEFDLVRRSDGLKITRTNWVTNPAETLSP